MRAYLALAMIVISVVVLELARRDVEITGTRVGDTPVTSYARAGADGPVVVVAHGFAGSQQMMQGYALPLARAGYRVFVFEFLGHGRHRIPMSGDVGAVDGTTRLLVSQTHEVIDAVGTGTQPVALIGHSMATDVLVRVVDTRPDIGPVVLISAFSQEIDADTPETLLLIPGAWEAGLRGFALEAVRMVTPGAVEGATARVGDVSRRTAPAPFSEHVSVLQSRAGRAEALGWLDQAYGRTSQVTILPTGWAILGVLCGLVLLFGTVAGRLPARAALGGTISGRRIAVLLGLPALIAPVVAVPLNTGFLPVLVADYLMLHLLVFGAIQLALLRVWQVPLGALSWAGFGLLILWCALFGFALDRYAANFWPTAERVWIICVVVLGAVPYMVADAALTARAGLLRRFCIRASFLLSLGIAVALDFEGLFFLLMIAPVLVLFYLVFGTMGRRAAQVSGPLASGLALGVVLAWALGVSFPLFQA